MLNILDKIESNISYNNKFQKIFITIKKKKYIIYRPIP